MRVGLVIYGDLAFASGGFLYDRMLVAALREAGDSVGVISLPWKDYGSGLLQNIEPRLRSRLLDWNGDLLLQDELVHPSLFILNRTMRRRRQIPRVSIVHHLRQSERPARGGSRLSSLVERAYLRSVDGFLFNSQVTRRTVEDLAGRQCPGVVITPGRGQARPPARRHEIERRAAEGGPLRVLFVGSFIPRKGLLTLVAALARLPREKWRLRIVGSASGHRRICPAQVRRAVEGSGVRGNVNMRRAR